MSEVNKYKGKTVKDMFVIDGIEPETDRDEKGRWVKENLWSKVYRQGFGRPRKYETAEDLADKFMEYFSWADGQEKSGNGRYTESGLLFYARLTKQNFRDYKKNPEFTETIEMLLLVVENHWEKKLDYIGSAKGAMDWLKNKAGWKDESKIDQTVTTVKANFGTADPEKE